MLSEAIEPKQPTGKAKGLFAWDYVQRGAGPTRTLIGCKSGDNVTGGVIFNYCPFCGEAIDQPARIPNTR